MAGRPPDAAAGPPGDDHPLADGLAAVLDGEVGFERVDVASPEHRRPQLDPLGVGMVEVLGGVPEHAAAVRRVVEAGLRLTGAGGGRGLGVLAGDVVDLRAHLGLRRGRGVGGADGSGCVFEDVGHEDDGSGAGVASGEPNFRPVKPTGGVPPPALRR